MMIQRVERNPKPRPRFIEPMECRRVATLPQGNDWLYEIKQNGYRIIGVIDHGTTVLYSMSGLNYTSQFPLIAEAMKWLREAEAVFDGEVVALDAKGHASFQLLQSSKTQDRTVVYYVFDLLHLNGRELLNEPPSKRREALERVASRFSDPLRLNPVFRVPLPPLVEQVRKLQLEGIVAKRSSSIYVPVKVSDSWQKHRFNQEAEFVIGVYVAAGRNFSSLIVGEYRGANLYYVKRVAGGFTPALREKVYEEFQGLKTSVCPFANLPEPNRSGHGLTSEKMKDCVWLKPERRCELEFVERTRGGRLRHAVFRRLIS